MERISQLALLLLAGLALCAGAAGCRGIRVPAIDPSGERLFLPAPSSTTLAGPSPPKGAFSFLPRPAYVAPPPPPPCPEPIIPEPIIPEPIIPEPSCGQPLLVTPQVGSVQTPQAARLTLTPTRLVAPVGSEVVLVSGICGGDGYYVMRQPLEWTLSRESVGQFVEVAGQQKWLLRFTRNKPEKRSADFAVGRTSVWANTITRGNADATDDVRVRRGQSWISVTSDVEGTSRISALAPAMQDWSLRRQTATIYWIDAEWQLPAPAVVSAGQSHLLSTTLTRSDGVTPLAGWLVRYEVVGGPTAGFAPSNSAAVDVISNEAGQAGVELVPATTAPGSTQVRIQIIRPGQTAGDAPRLVVGQGWTSVNWSAPGLALTMSGPESAAVETAVSYRIDVTNPGDLVSSDVVVSDVLPPGLALLSSDPPGNFLGDRLEWRLGDLPGHSSSTITVNCRAAQPGEVQHCAAAKSAEGLTANHCVATRIIQPSIGLNMLGPEAAEVGQRVEYRIEIRNLGVEVLREVALTDTFDAGLEHSAGEVSPIRRVLGDLAPGATQEIAVEFIVRSEGRQCHTLEVTSLDGQRAAASRCLTATRPAAPPPAPGVQLRLSGPPTTLVDQKPVFKLLLANTGNVPLTGVEIVNRCSPSLEPNAALPAGFAFDPANPRLLTWQVDNLGVGQQQEFTIECKCLRADPAATLETTVISTEGATDRATATIRIDAAAPDRGGPPVVPPGPDVEPPARGELTVSIADRADPIRVRQEVEYLIVVKNDRNVSDKNVTLTVEFPAGLRFKKINSSAPHTTQTTGNSIELSPFAEVRPGESLTFNVFATGESVGKFRVQAKVKSLRTPDGVSAAAETTVSAE